MKKLLMKFTKAIVVGGTLIAAMNTANAYQIYGTGDNFGSGWSVQGNNIYGTGDNFGSGWTVQGNNIFGTGDNFGRGWTIN
jgi:hypothetical protein